MFDKVSKTIDVKKDKTKLDRIIKNPVLYSNSENPQITFITDKLLSKTQIDVFRKNILDSIHSGLSFQIVYAFKVKPSTKDLNKIGKFFREYGIDVTKYIKPYSRVVTFGRALYLMTKGNTTIQVKGFYDFVFNDTFFLNPDLKTRVYPVDDFFSWIDKDTFSRFFTLKQIEYALAYKKERVSIPKLNLVKVLGEEEVKKFLFDNMEAKGMSFDTETDGFSPIDNHVGCLTLAFDGTTGYYLRWSDVMKNKDLFNDFIKNKFTITNNGKFDCKMMKPEGITNVHIDFDNLNAGHIINEMRSNGLKSQAFYYTWFGNYDQTLDDYKDKYKKLKNYLEIPEELLSEYATMDAIITFQVYEKQKAVIEKISKMDIYSVKDWNLGRLYYEVIVPALNTAVDMELNGFDIDRDKLNILAVNIQADIDRLEKKFKAELNVPDNINIYSDEQLGNFLESKGFEDFGRAEKGYLSINEKSREKWVKLGRKAIVTLTELTSKKTLQKTYIGVEADNSGAFQYIHSDGKMHPTFAVMLADSLRCKCKGPNFQNYPSTPAKGALLVRPMFVPPSEDYVIGSYDMAGLQARLVAMYLKDDSLLRDIFINLSGDAHSVNAVNIMMNNSVTLEHFLAHKKEEPYATTRKKSKGILFGFLFGRGAWSFGRESLQYEWSLPDVKTYIQEKGLSRRLGKLIGRVDREEYKTQFDYDEECRIMNYIVVAQDLREKFFKNYNRLSEYNENRVEEVKRLGYSISKYGGIRRVPELLYVGKDDRQSHIANLENIALNSHIQNEESVMMQRATVKLDEWFKANNMKSYLNVYIHDAIELMMHKDEVVAIDKKIKEIFNEYYPEYNGIELEVEGTIADYYKGHRVVTRDKATGKDLDSRIETTLWDMGFDSDYAIECLEKGIRPEVVEYA